MNDTLKTQEPATQPEPNNEAGDNDLDLSAADVTASNEIVTATEPEVDYSTDSLSFSFDMKTTTAAESELLEFATEGRIAAADMSETTATVIDVQMMDAVAAANEMRNQELAASSAVKGQNFVYSARIMLDNPSIELESLPQELIVDVGQAALNLANSAEGVDAKQSPTANVHLYREGDDADRGLVAKHNFV